VVQNSVKRDITVDTLEPLKRKLDGLMEAARSFGQKRTPYAAMSRGVAGFIDRSLVVTLPGSRGGASESMAAFCPLLGSYFDVCRDCHIRGI
jgi:molybdopterin biosynthesis enzyme MoaB